MDRDKRTTRKLFEKYKIPCKQHKPRSIHIITDATFFGKRTEYTSWCVGVVRDDFLKKFGLEVCRY